MPDCPSWCALTTAHHNHIGRAVKIGDARVVPIQYRHPTIKDLDEDLVMLDAARIPGDEATSLADALDRAGAAELADAVRRAAVLLTPPAQSG